MAAPEIDPARLARVTSLARGAHEPNDDGHWCAMEAVAFVAHEPWSDHPHCASPVIATFMRAWNDALPDDERTALLLPLVPRLVGTRGSAALEGRRALMSADWLVRVHAPAWLRVAGFDAHADALAALPEITSLAQVPSIRGVIEAARDDVAIVAAAGTTTFAAAWVVADATAGAAAVAAARIVVGGGARDWGVARDAAWGIARNAARVAAEVAAKDALAATRTELQSAAVHLVARMIDAREAM